MHARQLEVFMLLMVIFVRWRSFVCDKRDSTDN